MGVSDGTWRNWAGNLTSTPKRIERPRTESEAIAQVRSAISEEIGVRVAGSGHAFSPLVPTDGVILDLSHLSGISGIDTERRRVRVYGGTRIHDIGDPLWEHGLALANQGDIDHQMIMGAVSTATHGAGVELGSFSSAVRWMRLITGRGDIIEIGENQPRELRAAATSLGTLGAVLEVELEVVPAYDLQEEISSATWGETRDGWEHNFANNRHYSFFWCPADVSPSLYGLETEVGTDFADLTYVKRYGAALDPDETKRSDVRGHRRDRSYRIYPDIDPDNIPEFHEVEYFVPFERGLEAVAAARDLMRDQHPEQLYPLEVRSVAAEESYLAPAYQRASTVLSVSGAPGTDYLPYLHDFDALMDTFGARPHWGKIHFLDRARLERIYPALDEFLTVRDELDPRRTFLNAHTRELFG